MSTDEELLQQVNAILTERSKKALELSKKAVLEEKMKHPQLQEALTYFMQESCNDASHPTLLSLACEAVGGNPEDTVEVGAAIAVLASAADIHDDIIDQSLTKQGKMTVFGKFGKDIAIVAADVLWVKGMLMLAQAADRFPTEKKQAILQLAKEAFFDIGNAEAKETSLRGNVDLAPEEFLEIIKMKVALAEASAKIGAIIGNGTAEQIENLGEYAKTLGVLMTIREEFINMFEPDELVNRFKNEILPLPILHSFNDISLKQKILQLLQKSKVTEAKLNVILETIYQNSQVLNIGKYMRETVKNTINRLYYTGKPQNELKQLLQFTLQDLP